MTDSNTAFETASSLVTIKNGIIIADSLGIAEKFGKKHYHVLESIKNMDCSKTFGETNFRFTSYLDSQGKKRPLVEMTRDGFSFLVMGFTGRKSSQWKEAYIKAFNDMERALIETKSTAPYVRHTKRDVQITNSKAVNATLDKVGGKSSIIAYNTANCLVQSGKPPKHWKRVGKADCFPVKVSRSAKEVLRIKAPPVACGMSLSDQLVVNGGDMVESISIGKDSQVLFQRILAMGITPSELLM